MKYLAKNISIWRDFLAYESLLSIAQIRLMVLTCLFLLGYGIISVRLCMTVLYTKSTQSRQSVVQTLRGPRANIVDANGEILATDVVSYSVYADPKTMLDTKEAASALRLVLPNLSYASLVAKFEATQNKRFVWIVRNISPSLQFKIKELGIPGVCFRKERQRVYPQGSLCAHVLGYCDIDGQSVCGVERYFDRDLSTNVEKPLKLSIDIRFQHIAYNALEAGLKTYRAKSGNVMIMDDYGQLLASVSLPVFDPNAPGKGKALYGFDRNFNGVFEIGSSMKIFTWAIALESGTANANSKYDARTPIRIGRFAIDDCWPQRRFLSLEEGFFYSSNLAALQMAVDFGAQRQQYYFQKLGLLSKPTVETLGVRAPIVPQKWTSDRLKTISYGYGIAETPIAFLKAVGTVLNEGRIIKPTLLALTEEQKQNATNAPHVISKRVSNEICRMMRLAVTDGTGRRVNIPGYHILGKTGTAYQACNGGYNRNERNTTFMACLIHKGRKYFILVMLEAPQPTAGSGGFALAAYNAIYVARDCIERIAPLLNVVPDEH